MQFFNICLNIVISNNLLLFLCSASSVMYVQESWGAEAKVFLDPNELAPDGTISIKGYEFSKDSNLFAYGLSKNGSDWYKIKVCSSKLVKYNSVKMKSCVSPPFQSFFCPPHYLCCSVTFFRQFFKMHIIPYPCLVN